MEMGMAQHASLKHKDLQRLNSALRIRSLHCTQQPTSSHEDA